MPRAALVAALLLGLLVAGCGDAGEEAQQGRSAVGEFRFPPAPVAAGGALDPAAESAAADAVTKLADGVLDGDAVERIGASGDPRLGWLLADLLRFIPPGGADQDRLVASLGDLTSADPAEDPSFERSPWLSVSNHMIAPVAFEAEAAREALAAGEAVTVAGVELAVEAGGLVARETDGAELPAHEAFWFAWSQFHPETELWEG